MQSSDKEIVVGDNKSDLVALAFGSSHRLSLGAAPL